MRFVYFVKPIGMRGPVKIGCSDKPAKRCRSISAWSPFPLEVVAKIEGDEIIESRFHRAFVDTHSHLEWFAWSPELQGTIDAINAGQFEVDTLPAYAGAIKGLKEREKGLTDLDCEYFELRKRYMRLPYSERLERTWPPEPFNFVKFKSEERKRAEVADLRARLERAA